MSHQFSSSFSLMSVSFGFPHKVDTNDLLVFTTVTLIVRETYVILAFGHMIFDKSHRVETTLSQRNVNFSMLRRNRALLIGSPFGDLRGPLNDVELMTTVLEEQDLEIVNYCGTQTTSDNMPRPVETHALGTIKYL